MLQGGRGREVEISTLYLHHRQLLLKRSNTGVGHIRADEIQRPERRHIRQVYKAGVGDLRAIETLRLETTRPLQSRELPCVRDPDAPEGKHLKIGQGLQVRQPRVAD